MDDGEEGLLLTPRNEGQRNYYKLDECADQ